MLKFRRAVTLIRKHQASVLLGHEGYRATLRHDPQLVLMHIDDLLAKVKSASEDGGEIDGEGSLSRGLDALFGGGRHKLVLFIFGRAWQR